MKWKVSDVVEELRDVAGERWWRFVAVGDNLYSGSPGAPAVLVRAARYWWQGPKGTSAAQGIAPVERIRDEDLPFAVRRWIASRLAWWARDYLTRDGATRDGVVSTLGTSLDDVSEDARIATDALLLEANLPAADTSKRLGFRGPDEWYVA